MLKRRSIRRYLLALLCSEECPQGPDCDIGPLYRNCPKPGETLGEAINIFDSYTHQIDALDAPPRFDLSPMCAAVNIAVEDESTDFGCQRISSNSITFKIEIIARANSGDKRQDILDLIQCRVYHRLWCCVPIEDAQTGEKLKPIITMAKGNNMRVRVGDRTDSDYTVRTLTFTLEVDECIFKPDCKPLILCFDFSQLTILDKPRPTVDITTL